MRAYSKKQLSMELREAIFRESIPEIRRCVALGVDIADAGAIEYAMKNNRIDALNALLDFSQSIDSLDRNGQAPLHCAARPKYIDIAKLLIKRGADPFVKNRDGLTPKLLALVRSETAILFPGSRSLRESYSELYKYLESVEERHALSKILPPVPATPERKSRRL